MSNWIKIRNLKSIKSLDFRVPGPGVHLLSGTNGSGKTSLLACLRRIGHGYAFQSHFQTSKHNHLDSYSAAEVIYCVGDESVTYAYAGERWVPRPRSSSGLVRRFNYPDVYYAGATAARLTPRPEDFRPTRVKQAPLALRDAANLIFETPRFTDLKTINVTRGAGNQAFVLMQAPESGQRQSYVSERNFSLGELCVLKLLRELLDCKRGSLVLIDELELALHPRAQIGLLDYLKKIAQEKALTVIVSTHSVTLLKRAPRSQILFLDQKDDCTVVLEGCFPAYAIGNLAHDEERVPDAVLYVEDEAARSVLESLKRLALAEKYSKSSDVFPTVNVVPVGDFKAVIRFYDRNRTLLPDRVKQWIVLDKDVETESLSIMAASSNNPMRDAFHRHEAAIRYLPFTPEVGLVKFLANSRQQIQSRLRKKYVNNFINLPSSMVSITSQSAAQERSQCKAVVRQVFANICNQVPGLREETLADEIYALFAEQYFKDQHTEAMQFLGPLITT